MSLKRLRRPRRRRRAPKRPKPSFSAPIVPSAVPRPSPPASDAVIADGAEIVGEAAETGLSTFKPLEPPKVDVRSLMGSFWAEKSDTTIGTYKRDLKAFAAFLGARDMNHAIGSIVTWTGPQVNQKALDWILAMEAKGQAPGSIARRISTLRSLLKVAQTVGLIDWTLNVTVKGGKRRVRNVEGPTDDQLRRMIESCGTDRRGRRDRLILLLLGVHGLRRFEVRDLKRKDYDRERKRLFVRGKGGKNVWVDFSQTPIVLKALDEWIEAEGIEHVVEAPILCNLVSRERTEMSLAAVTWAVSDVGKRVGVHAWPHALRHTCITDVEESTGSARQAQLVARHASIETTMAYIDNRQNSKLVADAVGTVERRLFSEES